MAIGTVVVNMNLIWYVILYDPEIKGSCDFMGRSPSRYNTILPGLMARGILLEKI